MMAKILRTPISCYIKTYITIMTLLISSCCCTIGHCAMQKKIGTLDRVVAVVNNEAIPESELNQQLQFLLSELRHSETDLPPPRSIEKTTFR